MITKPPRNFHIIAISSNTCATIGNKSNSTPQCIYLAGHGKPSFRKFSSLLLSTTIHNQDNELSSLIVFSSILVTILVTVTSRRYRIMPAVSFRFIAVENRLEIVSTGKKEIRYGKVKVKGRKPLFDTSDFRTGREKGVLGPRQENFWRFYREIVIVVRHAL